jgi:tetratricopeptide (TPR) repeat protein
MSMNHTSNRQANFQSLMPALLLAALTLLAYMGTTQNKFVWDSVHFLLGYQQHLASLDWANFKWMLTTTQGEYWHPLVWFSWAFDYHLYGGLKPWGFHLSNNIYHALNSVLLLFLARIVFKHLTAATDNQALIAAFLAAALFAVHPQHVESVAWVAERKDLLFQAFMLLALLSYFRYADCPRASKARWYLLTLAAFVLALASKPMAVTLPAVLLLLDVYPLRRSSIIPAGDEPGQPVRFPNLILEKLPFFVLSALVIVLTLQAQSQAHAFSDVPMHLRVLNAFHSIVFYVEKFLIPLNFTPQYPYFVGRHESITLQSFIPAAGCVAITGAAIVAWFKGYPAWLVAWLFYLITLAPVVGVIQVGGQGAADRYTYFTTLPFYFLLGAGTVLVMQRGTRAANVLMLSIFGAAILYCVVATQIQIRIWHNEFTLWKAALSQNPDNVSALNNLGILYAGSGVFDKAAPYFDRSAKLVPNTASIRVLVWRSLTDMRLGRYKQALQDLVALGTVTDGRPDIGADQYCIQYDIGWAYAQLGLYAEAEELFGRVVPQAAMGDDASTWRQWLQSQRSNNESVADNPDLPGICQTLVPSKMLLLKRPSR